MARHLVVVGATSSVGYIVSADSTYFAHLSRSRPGGFQDSSVQNIIREAAMDAAEGTAAQSGRR